MSTETQVEIYDVYESQTVNGNPTRWYWANVDTPKLGKLLAELITEHEGRQIEWGQEKLFPRPAIHFDSVPLVGFGATVYTVNGQVKVCVIIINPGETPYSLHGDDFDPFDDWDRGWQQALQEKGLNWEHWFNNRTNNPEGHFAEGYLACCDAHQDPHVDLWNEEEE